MQDHHDKIGVIKTEGKRSLGHQEFGEAPKKAARQGHRRLGHQDVRRGTQEGCQARPPKCQDGVRQGTREGRGQHQDGPLDRLMLTTLHAHAQTRDGCQGQQGAARCRDTEQPLRITRTPTQTQTQTLMPKPTRMPAPTLRCARSKCERTYRVWAQGKCVSISMSAIPVVRHRCNGGGAATGGACGGLGGW